MDAMCGRFYTISISIPAEEPKFRHGKTPEEMTELKFPEIAWSLCNKLSANNLVWGKKWKIHWKTTKSKLSLFIISLFTMLNKVQSAVMDETSQKILYILFDLYLTLQFLIQFQWLNVLFIYTVIGLILWVFVFLFIWYCATDNIISEPCLLNTLFIGWTYTIISAPVRSYCHFWLIICKLIICKKKIIINK